MFRGLSTVAAVLILTVLALSVSILVYFWSTHLVERVSSAESAVRKLSGAIKVDAAYSSGDSVVAYVRSLGAVYIVDRVYIYDRLGRLVASAPLNPPVRLEPGHVKVIVVPVGAAASKLHGGLVRFAFAAESGLVAYSPLVYVSPMPASTMVGLIIGRYYLWSLKGCPAQSLTLDPNRIHWIYADLVSGKYIFRSIDNGQVFSLNGRATVFKNTNTLNLESMKPEERAKLGPLVIFINPERAAQDYTVTIVDVAGHPHIFRLQKLVNDPSQVALDALACFEDMWWPGNLRRQHGFDYSDHVVRITLFTNNTVRIEILWAAGYYLHMFMYNPKGLPPFNDVPKIVLKYLSHHCRLDKSDSVVYVKAHLAWFPYHGTSFKKFIWDPVNGRWLDPRHTIVFIAGR